MEKFFNSDNGVMRALSKIFDIGWLSLIYIVFCVPVFTIGAATTSLYYVSAKVLRRNRSYVWREFWSSFKMNLKQSTIIWVIIALLYVLLYWNIQITGITDEASEYGGYLAGAYLAMMLIMACIACYIFPLISRFDMKLSQILRLSLYCAFRHFLHTIVLLAILLAAGYGLFVGVWTGIIILILVVPGLAGFLYTFPMEHVMKKYMPKSETKYTESGEEIVEWYNE
ncbi:MAG: YesL family protein [Lachnospiraceae bacterium]|nr:YesL family protein [Lachnospiraceae bacterium]